MIILAKGTLAFVKVTGHSWLKMEVLYDYSTDYDGANWQDDYGNKTTSQENSNLQDHYNNIDKDLNCLQCKLTGPSFVYVLLVSNYIVSVYPVTAIFWLGSFKIYMYMYGDAWS